MRSVLLLTVVALVLTAAGSVAAREAHKEVFGRSTACATKCEAPTKFKYKTSMVHVFDYHASAKFVSGSREPQLGVTARAHITIAGPCEMILAISHVRLADSSGSSPGFAAALERNSLRFAFNDGQVSAVCPDVEEPLWVLNFKRGLLSTFQNNMPNLKSEASIEVKESDVSGLCTSTYSSKYKDAANVNITRVRTSSCIPPKQPHSSCLITNVLQYVPFLSTEQKCLQMLSGGTLKEAICRENFRYPSLLTNEEDKTIAALTARLKLVYQFKVDFVVVPNYEARRSSLEFEWENREEQSLPDDWMSSLEDILPQLQNMAPSPALFYRLTELLRKMSYEQISEAFNTISPELWETVSMALLKIGSEPAMRMVMNFIRYDALPHHILFEAREYYLKYFELNSPMIEMIEMFEYNRPSVALEKLKYYCLTNTQCMENEKIKKIFESVLSQTDVSCKPKPIDDHQHSWSSKGYNLKRALQTWAALGQFGNDSKVELQYCFKSNVSEVQYSSLEVLANSPCNSYDYKKLLLFAQNSTLDSYTQIITYLALIRCPTTEFKSFLFAKLENEKVNQVTSYIWTHLSNQRNMDWVTNIARNSQLKQKFKKPILKFSRNFHKEFTIGNTLFNVNLDTILSGFTLKPQHIRFMLSSEEFIPNNIFEFEVREKNETRTNSYHYYDYDYPEYDIGNMMINSSIDIDYYSPNETSKALDLPSFYQSMTKKSTKLYTTSVITVRFMGVEIYSDEHRMDGVFDGFGASSILQHLTLKVYEIAAGGSFNYMFSTLGMWLMDEVPVIYNKKLDLVRQYPTSIGMPFQCQLNLTDGLHKGSLAPMLSKQLEATMLIDATHTNVGVKIIATTNAFPGVNISSVDDGFSLVTNLPNEKTTIFEFKCEKFDVENSKLTPRFFPNDTPVETFCIPLMKNLTGCTYCVEYCPQSEWWPVSNVGYRLIYDRAADIRGINITGRYKRSFYELIYQVMDLPERTWKLSVHNLAYFANVELITPYMSLNGSGTFKSEVLRLKESGQALNMSGTLRCKGDEAPFLLTGESLIRDDPEQNTFNVFFYSSIFEGTILSTYDMGDNMTFEATIPYRIKNNATQNIRITATSYKYNVTRTNVIANSTDEVCTKRICNASVTFSEFPQSALTVELVRVYGSSPNTTDTLNANITMVCEDHLLEAIVSTRCDRDTSEYNSTIQGLKPNNTIVWNESLRCGEENSRVFSNLICNDDILYETEVNFGMSMERGMYSSARLLVPCREPNASYPLLKIDFDQNFNLFKQKYHILCMKSYKESSLKLNMTAGIVTDKNTGIPLGFGRFMQHYGIVDLSCNNHNTFRITGHSDLSSTLKNLDLHIAVQTPFTRWEKEAFKLKLTKKGDLVNAKLTEKRYKQKPEDYVLQGSMDYDILTNLVRV